LDADLISGDDAVKASNARSESHVRLIEADGIDAIGAQRFAAELRTSGAMEEAVSDVPATPLQTLSDCWMTCSISLRLPLAV